MAAQFSLTAAAARVGLLLTDPIREQSQDRTDTGVS